ncbi:hypothetical protein [Streptomyces sp. NPDC002746]
MDNTKRQQQIRVILTSVTLAQARHALEAVLNVAESAEQNPDHADFHGREVDEVWAEHRAKSDIGEEVLHAMESALRPDTAR